ncbi:AmmeMemoRadiSam system protein A [Vibrio salinus]|uniref:AmmeMemoRadiSam system protein A n=1 Tax=Vibrio salinus TaxID=2899784 RepID=UPI001E2B6C7A|nr:AmmeMemoRadiSam system protein A [Vibrio salinus]MCE0495515.1 AmmeMemoRadiSam system protein A [Vibrio salinus]
MSVTLQQNYSQQDMHQLVNIARQAIHDYFGGYVRPPETSSLKEDFTRNGACFVTLEVNHQLQGCLGSIAAHQPLAEDVYNKARSAACQDPRFPPLRKSQLKDLSVEVSVLSPLHRLDIETEAALERYLSENRVGVILSDSSHRAVFLPQVWDQLPDTKEFLRHLKQKGGWPEGYWSASVQVDVFSVTCAKEPFEV